MKPNRILTVAAYLVGASLIFIPLFDATVSMSPPHPGDFRWRFGAAGFLANALMVPNAGILLVLVTAIASGHATLRRIVGIGALVVAAACLSAMGLFVLDALQTRPAVRPEMMTAFAIASVAALVKLLIGATTLVVLGLVGLRSHAVRETAVQAPRAIVFEPASTARK